MFLIVQIQSFFCTQNLRAYSENLDDFMGKTCMFSDGKKEEGYKFYQFTKMKIVKVLLSRH